MEQAQDKLVFKTRTTVITIDYNKCKQVVPGCGFACIKACRLYGRGVLKIEGGLPRLAVPPEEVVRLDNECLACEIHCMLEGANAITIEVPL